MITVTTCFWRANKHTAPASRGYEPFWVDRLAAGFARNLTIPHRFIVFTDRTYRFAEGVEQQLLSTDEPDWSCMIEPFQLDEPSIIVGLDTVVTGNTDEMARYCLEAGRIALPRSPGKDYACNGVALVPAGHRSIYANWSGENDMEWLRTQPHDFIDDLFPGQVASYKCAVRPNGLGDTRIVYFHGRPKMSDALHERWVRDHWR